MAVAASVPSTTPIRHTDAPSVAADNRCGNEPEGRQGQQQPGR